MSDADQPAHTLSTRQIYRGRIFTVDVDRVKLPHGPEVDMEVVRHPGSVVIIPIAEPGRIILVRQYRHVVSRYLWELPAGSLAAGEDPVEGARRECHEEIGLLPGAIEQVAALWPTPGFCSERMFFFRCSELYKPETEAHQDEDESLEPRTFGVEEIRAMLRSGDIADMKTAVALGLLEGSW
jgi:ADP-ribose pyrophosphatase